MLGEKMWHKTRLWKVVNLASRSLQLALMMDAERISAGRAIEKEVKYLHVAVSTSGGAKQARPC